MKSMIRYLIIGALLVSCGKSFRHFHKDDFVIFLKKKEKEKSKALIDVNKQITDRLCGNAYVLRLDHDEVYFGGEKIRVLDTVSYKSGLQYSFLMFLNGGRVIQGSYAWIRDKEEDDTNDSHFLIDLPDTISICDKEDKHSKQGFYKLLTKRDSLSQYYQGKSNYNRKLKNEFISLELERKDRTPFLNKTKRHGRNKKHYLLSAEIENLGDRLGDTLHIVEYMVPKKFRHIRPDHDIRTGYQIFDGDEMFLFDLKFVREKKQPYIDFTGCDVGIDITKFNYDINICPERNQ